MHARVYSGILGYTRGERGLKRDAGGDRGYRCIQGYTAVYRGIQGETVKEVQ